MSEDYKVQISISLPPVGQYAKGDMANFRGESAEEVAALLEAAIEADLFEKAAVASKVYLVSTGLGATNVETVEKPKAVNESSGSSDATVTHLRTCAHGKRTRREGGGQNGKKPWVGYFCPLEKGNPDQCDVEWEDK